MTMKPWILVGTAVAGLGLLPHVGIEAQSPGVVPDTLPVVHPDYRSVIERSRVVLDSLRRDLGFPGMGVAVAVNGRILWSEGMGLADVAREMPVTRRSVFPMYSVSKGVTGLALARLSEQGRIDLDAPVQRYVPGFPEPEEGTITPRLLAGHLAGIRHYRPGAGEGTRLWHCDTAEEALAPFINDPLVHPPGTDFSYTSFGFVLLSAAMERAAGQSFADLVAAEVFRPLGMSGARMRDTHAWVPNQVSTYEFSDSLGVIPARRLDVTCKMGAGAFESSAEDLARMGSLMFGEDYVGPATLDVLFTPQRNAAGEQIIEGLGWDVAVADDGLKWVRRTGGNLNGWSAVMAYPEYRLSIALMANMRGRDWIHDDADRIARWFIEALEDVGPPPADRGSESARAFIGGRVVDVVEGVVREGWTVLVEGERITAVGPDAEVVLPDGVKVVDLEGAYVLPGLSDMHVHTGTEALPLFLPSGVTTVRVMMGTEEVLDWRRNRAGNDAVAPRVFLTGPLMAGVEVPWPHELVDTPEGARESVRRQAEAGYDFVKVYEGLERDVYDAIVEEAGREGLPLVGHVPSAVGLSRALAAGQRTIEHTEQPMYAHFGRPGVMTLPLDRISEVVALFEGADVMLTPTLAGAERIHRRGTSWHDAQFKRHEMRWMDPDLAGWWSNGRNQQPSDDALRRRRHFMVFQREFTAALHRAGIDLLSGTDTPYPLLVPGFSLHHELEALEDVGLTPLEVIRTSTVNAARALGLAGELGVVTAGALADLVIVDENPLESLATLRRPRAVVRAGVYFDRLDLDVILRRALPN